MNTKKGVNNLNRKKESIFLIVNLILSIIAVSFLISLTNIENVSAIVEKDVAGSVSGLTLPSGAGSTATATKEGFNLIINSEKIKGATLNVIDNTGSATSLEITDPSKLNIIEKYNGEG